MAVHVDYLLNDKLPTTYFQQVQGQLYITECKWVDFVSYYPEMPLLVVRVERDEEFIKKLDAELSTFCKELDEVEAKIRSKKWKDICVRESYTDHNGEEKVSWNRVGILIDKGDKQYVKLFHMPGALCSVFEQRKKKVEGVKTEVPEKDLDEYFGD